MVRSSDRERRLGCGLGGGGGSAFGVGHSLAFTFGVLSRGEVRTFFHGDLMGFVDSGFVALESLIFCTRASFSQITVTNF